MGYTPYKMLGHELKGPNQKDPAPTTMKAFGTNDTEFLDQEGTETGTSLNYGSAVGGSPNKLGAAVAAPVVDAASAVKDPEAVAPVDVGGGLASMGLGGGDAGAKPTVPSHGDESHTGGAVGGEPEAPWEAKNAKDFMSMKGGARKDYMGGLDKDQRKQQMQAMQPKPPSFGGLFGGGGFGSMFSDIRLKENIDRVGISESGIPIYEFNYIGDNSRYSGAMAQDLLETDAVSMHESGFYMVDYNSIDIDMKLI